MPKKGFINGCMELVKGIGHTPPENHVCFSLDTTNELVLEYPDANKYVIVTSAFHRCSIDKSTDQSIDTTTWTSLTFDQEKYDIGGMHDNASNNQRITIIENGEYEINYHIKHDAADKSSYESRVYKNGSAAIEGTCGLNVGSKDASHNIISHVSDLITLVIGDYIELQFYHDNDAAQDIISSDTFFSAKRVY